MEFFSSILFQLKFPNFFLEMVIFLQCTMVPIVVGEGGGAQRFLHGIEGGDVRIQSLNTRIYDKGCISESRRDGFLQQFGLFLYG